MESTQQYEYGSEPIQQFEYGYVENLRLTKLKKGIITIEGLLSGNSGFLLGELQLATPPYRFIINSPGGEVSESFAIYDLIREASSPTMPVTVTALGMAASAACMIVLQAGDKRFSYPNTIFMLHELSKSRGKSETTTESADNTREIRKIQHQTLSILSKRSGKSVDTIAKLLRRKELWLSAQEAKEWGLIDGIVGEDV